MKIIKQEVFLEEPIDNEVILKKIERAGRTCYKSEEKASINSAQEFVRKIIKRGHESVLEHINITVRWITDRGVTHELVRHRLASYSQESTRYCNYAKKDLEFIQPVDFNFSDDEKFVLEDLEALYNDNIKSGRSPQQARALLPNCLKTEIVITMNLRSWRHFFKLRCAKATHPQMRDMAIQTLALFSTNLNVVFDDLQKEFLIND